MTAAISPSLASPCVTAALLVALGWVLAAGVLHGRMRVLLERRGVRPWRVRDTIGAFPLSLAGAALIGLAGWLVWCAEGRWSALLALGVGATWMAFGARAYLKLTR